MSTHILLTGVLHRAPESRTSRNGNSYVMATIRTKDGEVVQFWRMFVFSESAQAEAMRLREGDALSLQGVPKFELYRPENGETRLSLSVTADVVTALRAAPKERKPKAAAPPPDNPPPRPARDPGDMHRYSSVADRDLDDSLPF